jgi:copper chaperone CopZ
LNVKYIVLLTDGKRDNKMAIVKETYPVLGMTCASCVRKIETVLGKTSGVVSAAVNFATEKVTVEYDRDKIDLDGLQKIIKKIGYELIV